MQLYRFLMKKILNALLILTSLLGYLEWGKDQHMFLGQMEYDILFQHSPNTDTFLHPFVLVPLLGQLLLLITLFQKTPNRILTFTGLGCLGVLLVFIFIIGVMGGHIKTALSAVPFIIVAILAIRVNRKKPLAKRL